jgi:hypothetical protein
MNTSSPSRTSFLGALAILTIFATGAAPAAAEEKAAARSSVRLWVGSTGQFRVQAEPVKVVGDSVVLRRTDARQVTVPLARLCAADQQWVRTASAAGTSFAANEGFCVDFPGHPEKISGTEKGVEFIVEYLPQFQGKPHITRFLESFRLPGQAGGL